MSQILSRSASLALICWLISSAIVQAQTLSDPPESDPVAQDPLDDNLGPMDHPDLDIVPSEPTLEEVNVPGSRFATSGTTTFRNIRIKVDFSMLKSTLPADSVIFFKDFIIGPIVERIQSTLQVTGPTTVPIFSGNGCFTAAETPIGYRTQETDTDLILFALVKEVPASIVAYASACVLSPFDKRPLVGMVTVNSLHLKLVYGKMEATNSVIIHEIFHTLGFSSSMFARVPGGLASIAKKISKTTKTGTYPSTYSMTIPALLDFARTHFNCPTLGGFDLEDEGSAGSQGSHLERAWVGNDLMNPESSGRLVLSKFTLLIMNNLGWYRVNFAATEINDWGKGEGCGFFSPTCDPTKYKDFCPSPGARLCSKDRFSKATCLKTTFTDGCNIRVPLDAYRCSNRQYFSITAQYEEPSTISRCFDTVSLGIATAACYKTYCQSNNTIKIVINAKEILCTTVGQKITVGYVVITCPPYAEVCTAPRCPNDCNGNGTCRENNTCLCYPFFTGTDCGVYTGCFKSATLCALLKPPIISVTAGGTSTGTTTTGGSSSSTTTSSTRSTSTPSSGTGGSSTTVTPTVSTATTTTKPTTTSSTTTKTSTTSTTPVSSTSSTTKPSTSTNQPVSISTTPVSADSEDETAPAAPSSETQTTPASTNPPVSSPSIPSTGNNSGSSTETSQQTQTTTGSSSTPAPVATDGSSSNPAPVTTDGSSNGSSNNSTPSENAPSVNSTDVSNKSTDLNKQEDQTLKSATILWAKLIALVVCSLEFTLLR